MVVVTPANLERTIRESEFCAAIEVTNGVKPGRIKIKAAQARDGRQHLVRLGCGSAHGGIIAFRTRNIDDKDAPAYGLDFLHKIRGYEQQRATEAVGMVSGMHMHPNDKYLARTLLSLVREGMPLEGLLYPEDWREFKTNVPQLARHCWNPDQYSSDIKHIKGWVLERYTLLLCNEAMPNVTVSGPFKYHVWKDIDVCLIGSREDIYAGLNNPAYFMSISTAEPVKRAC